MGLNFNALNKQPRLSISSYDDCFSFTTMAANDKYLLYSSNNYFCLVDEQGIKKNIISNPGICATNIHWSSYLNQFLILNRMMGIIGLDISTSETWRPPTLKTFDEQMSTFTCYEEKLLVCMNFIGSVIQEYNLTDWNLKRTIKPPISCKKHESIQQMCFSTTGQYLAFVLMERDYPNFLYWIELRQSNDISVLHVLKLAHENTSYNILSVPNEKFLVNSCGEEKKIFVINNLNDKVEETISYDSDQQIKTTALIGGRCLIVQIKNPRSSGAQLRFHDL